MDFLMQIDHMALLYGFAALTATLVIAIVLFIKLRQQMKETRELSVKLDKMIDQVLEVGTRSDYNVRHKTFR